MSFFDAKNKFSDKQDISATSTPVYSTYELDFGATYDRPNASANTHPDLGQGEPLVVRFMINTTFATTTTYVQFALVHNTTGTPTTTTAILTETDAIAIASLTKGAYIPELKIPDQHYRYMRVAYVLTGGNLGTGVVSAWISPARGLRHR